MQATAEAAAKRRVGWAPHGRIAVVLNPNSRRNRRRPGRLPELQRIVGAHGVVCETGSVDELRSTLREVLEQGASCLVSDGGDGALNWMYNEILALEEELPGLWIPPLVPTRSGTIDFVATKAGLRGSAEQIVSSLVHRVASGRAVEVTHLDSLVLEGERALPGGRRAPFRRVGFAAAIGGVGQRFFDKYYRDPDPGASTIVRVVLTALASQAFGVLPLPAPRSWRDYAREVFAPTRARVTIDGSEVPGHEHGAIHAGAFDIDLGGVFHAFPLARNPGVLHFQAGTITPWQIAANLPRLYRGETIRTETLLERAGREMTVTATGSELLAPVVDGELFGGLTQVTVRPGPVVAIGRI